MEASQPEQPQNDDLLDPLLTTTTCNQCRIQIKPGEYRVVVVAAELGTVPEKIDPSRAGGRRRFLAFCARCSFGIVGLRVDEEGEFVARHSLARVFFGSTQKQVSQDLSQGLMYERFLRNWAEEGRLTDAGRQARENELVAAVRLGDGNTPEAPQPVTVSKKDDRLLMAEFLQSPEALNLKPLQRRIGELYSQGKKQVEIEREAGKDQTTVSRMLRDIKAKAYVWAQQKTHQEEAAKPKVAAAVVDRQLNALFPSYPRYNDVMAHAVPAGASIERSTGDNRSTDGIKVRPGGAGPNAFERTHDEPIDPRR
jgi:hypothetical protein